MPKRCQRPPSSHRLSHFNAISPARKAKTAPSRLGNAADANVAVPLMCSACTSRIASRATTAGVRTTASAKLNASARDFATPASIPAEMVAPERENPRNGKQSLCTAPMIPACFVFRSFVLAKLPVGFRLSKMPAIRIRIPAKARAGATSSRWLNRSSISACGTPRKAVLSMILMTASPTNPVRTVAKTTRSSKLLESSHTLEVCAPPLAPKVDDYSKHRARLEHDQKQCHGRRRRIKSQQLLSYDHMRPNLTPEAVPRVLARWQG